MRPPNSFLDTARGKVLIRPGTSGDTTRFSELRMEALRDNPTFFGSSYEANENWKPEWAFKVLTGNPQESCSFLADQDGRLLGTAGVRRLSGHKLRHSATIGGVYVRPDWRGLGIVDALVRACIAWAKERQVVIIKLAVVTSNLRALKAYQRLGFSIYGSEPKVILHKGIYYDEHLMALELEKDRRHGT
ncbi:MAG TPA: GNAT family N-acetyltransferase [Anaerolineales bacterium]